MGYEEKIRQLMDLNFDSEDYRAMFSNELALALRDIRAEYDAILEAQKGADNDSWYKAKFNEMMMTSQRSGNELAGAKDEVKKARAKYAELQKEIMALRAHNAALEERIAALEAELDEQAKLHRLAIDERDAEIEKLRAQLAAQILELKELMDSKLALDAEIATYRRLLQGEESRLKEHMAGGGGMVVQSSSSSASASAGGASQQVIREMTSEMQSSAGGMGGGSMMVGGSVSGGGSGGSSSSSSYSYSKKTVTSSSVVQ